MIVDCIVKPRAPPGACGGTYARKGNTIVGFLNESKETWAPTIPPQPCLRSPRATELLAQWHDKG